MLSIWFKTKPIERQRARESLRNRERERESCQLRQAVRQSRPNLKDRLQSLFLEIPIKKEENHPSVPLKKTFVSSYAKTTFLIFDFSIKRSRRRRSMPDLDHQKPKGARRI